MNRSTRPGFSIDRQRYSPSVPVYADAVLRVLVCQEPGHLDDGGAEDAADVPPGCHDSKNLNMINMLTTSS